MLLSLSFVTLNIFGCFTLVRKQWVFFGYKFLLVTGMMAGCITGAMKILTLADHSGLCISFILSS